MELLSSGHPPASIQALQLIFQDYGFKVCTFVGEGCKGKHFGKNYRHFAAQTINNKMCSYWVIAEKLKNRTIIF